MHGIAGWVNIDADPLMMFRFALKALNPLLRRGLLPFAPTTFDDYLRSPLPPGFLFWDIGRKPLPFPDGSASAVFTSHALEHFPRFVARRIAADVRRVLTGGGVFRVVVPDLELLARRYLAGLDRGGGAAQRVAVASLSARDVNYEFYRGRARYHIEPETRFDRFDLEAIYASVFKVQGHMYLYDGADLTSLLREAGFARIERRTFREGDCPDLVELDTRPEESLFVEAYR